MKKLFLSIFLFVATISFVSAQNGGGNQAERMARMKQRLKEELKLTDVQIDTVTAIQQGFQPRTREIRTDQAMSDADKQAKMKVISEERNKRFETSLGKELAQKLTEYYDKMQNRGGGRASQ